jgi:hypothetical protein
MMLVRRVSSARSRRPKYLEPVEEGRLSSVVLEGNMISVLSLPLLVGETTYQAQNQYPNLFLCPYKFRQ